MLDKFFCKVNDKRIEFPSEKEAIEYCKENDINPHGIILMGDKYIIKTKDSGFKTTMDKAIRLCDADYVVSVKEASDRDASRVIGIAQEIGFSTVDKGYTIVLKDGDDKMYSKFKREIIGIKGVKVL